MACVNMFNPEHQGVYGGGGAAAPPPMSPRISFSNDFVLDSATGCPTVRYERTNPASAASDFEFSVETYGMMTADELFFKGRLLPVKEHCAAAGQMQRMTLRDELLAADDDDGHGLTFSPSSASSRVLPPGKVSLRWKTLLGLRAKPQHSPTGKKQDKKQTKQLHQEQADQVEEEAAPPCSINTTPDQQDEEKRTTWRSACDTQMQPHSTVALIGDGNGV